MSVSFRALADASALEIVDGIEHRRLSIETAAPVEPEPVSVEGPFPFPVDAAVKIVTEALTFPESPIGSVRDPEGAQLIELVPGVDESLPTGTYTVELTGPMKLYLRLEGPLTVMVSLRRLEFAFDRRREIAIGARSYHQRPAATVTTTAEPTDLLSAISTFGSALKTTSCERSYPTLRGHPPTLELGETLSIPGALSAPETGLRLALPPTHRTAFVAAPLAYYLGAECVPASRPRVISDDGFEHALDTDRGFQSEVARVLQQVFFLDCLTRTEGYYDVALRERSVVEPLVDLDFERLYGASLSEQLAAYLSIPYDRLEPHLPRWALTAEVPAAPERATVLPYLADDLAIVRTGRGRRLGPSDARGAVLREVGSSRGAPTDADDQTPIVRLPPSGSLEQVWFGDGIPVGASKGLEAAYRHRLARTTGAEDVAVTVVSNGDVGDEERAVEAVYGSRDRFPFDVTLRRSLPAAELARTLEEDTDFLHYVGHIDDDGFDCPGGPLDVTTLESVGVGAFLLNACRSYRQGRALVERGSIGGVVTFADVIDSGAVRIGLAMARLLNRGFPLQSAFAIASGESIVAGNYLIVGDGTVDVVQPQHGAPIICDLETDDGSDGYNLTVRAYLPSGIGIGALAFPYVADNDEYFLPPGRLATFHLTESELREYLTWYDDPIRRDGNLFWPDGPDDPELLATDPQ